MRMSILIGNGLARITVTDGMPFEVIQAVGTALSPHHAEKLTLTATPRLDSTTNPVNAICITMDPEEQCVFLTLLPDTPFDVAKSLADALSTINCGPVRLLSRDAIILEYASTPTVGTALAQRQGNGG